MDFECIPNYERVDHICVPDEDFAHEINRRYYECLFGSYFKIPSGFRKIPGSMCKGGSDLTASKVEYCANGISDSSLSWFGILALLSTLIYSVYMVMWYLRDEVAFFDRILSNFDNFRAKLHSLTEQRREKNKWNILIC